MTIPPMNIRQLNHAAIPVDDVERSRQFYADVLGLQEIARPAFGFPGAWFRIGVDQELHLIGRGTRFVPGPSDRHFAMMVDEIDAWAAHLGNRGVEFTDPKPRPDGAYQIFLADPDGHFIELFTAPI